MKNSILLIFAALIGMASPAAATVLVNQPLDFDVPGHGYTSTSGSQQIAQDFVLAGAATANELSWWGSTRSVSYAFDILFFNDVAGLPDVNDFYSHTTGVLAGTFVGTDPDGGVSTSLWTTVIPDAVLDAGTTYWMSIREASGASWQWQHATSTGTRTVVRTSNNGTWQVAGSTERGANAYILEGNERSTIPEPSTALLLGLGMLGAGLIRRKRRS